MPTVTDAFLSLGLFPKQRVALVDEHSLAVILDMPIQFRFGFDDALETAEALQMCLPDVGDEAVVGVGNLARRVLKWEKL